MNYNVNDMQPYMSLFNPAAQLRSYRLPAHVAAQQDRVINLSPVYAFYCSTPSYVMLLFELRIALCATLKKSFPLRAAAAN